MKKNKNGLSQLQQSALNDLKQGGKIRFHAGKWMVEFKNNSHRINGSTVRSFERKKLIEQTSDGYFMLKMN